VIILAGEEELVLKALVLMPNDKTSEVGCLLAVARDVAKKREGTQTNPSIRALHFIAELGIFVAVYEAVEKSSITSERKEG
jgi:hypothetical protein